MGVGCVTAAEEGDNGSDVLLYYQVAAKYGGQLQVFIGQVIMLASQPF